MYADMIYTVRKMSKQKAGELFMTILAFVNDENPEVKDSTVDLVFEPIKHQLKRDLKKWETFKVKQAENGKKGGRPRKEETQIKPENPSLFLESQKSLNVTVNVNETVINRDKVYEYLRGAAPIGISKADVDAEVEKLMTYYAGKKIINLRNVCNSWMNNYSSGETMPNPSTPVRVMSTREKRDAAAIKELENKTV